MTDAFQLPANGVSLAEARVAIERLRGVAFMKLEALERKVEVVSGYAPHASSASTPAIIAKAVLRIKRGFAVLKKVLKHG